MERAKKYISGALAAMLDLGKGSGPMDHGFAIRNEFTLTHDEILVGNTETQAQSASVNADTECTATESRLDKEAK